MKTRKLYVLIAVMLCMIVNLTGCATSTQAVYDSGITNDEVYQSYDFWNKENELRIALNVAVVEPEEEDQAEEITKEEYKLSSKKQKRIQEIQEGIISFFQERYQLDVSEKLGKQEINFYTATGTQEGVLGYVDPENPDVLNLNIKLFKEEADKFETTYIHETLHQLGVMSKKTVLLDEGMADALADMICCYIGIEPVLTEYYGEARALAYQLLKADPEIVCGYLENENFSIVDRINNKLKDVSRPYEKNDYAGLFLDNMVTMLYNMNTGIDINFSVDPYWFAFEAQEVVRAYCQACNPSNDTIDYIRSHYLVLDYESTNIKQDFKNGYYFG